MTNFVIKKIKLFFFLNFLIKVWNFFSRIKIKIANSQQDLNEIYRLRWEIYAEEGHIDPNEFPNKQLSDEYDKSSLNLLAFKDNIPVGAVRFILNSEIGFPTEKAFNLLNFNIPREKIGEISKLCLKKEYRSTKDGAMIFLSLMSVIYKYMKKNKMKFVLIGVPLFLKKTFERLDFQLSIEELLTGPLKPENKEVRKTAKKYFEKFEIKPYLITIV